MLLNITRTIFQGNSQQTFVLMNTSWSRLEDIFRLRLQNTSSNVFKTSSSRQYIHLTHTSSEDVFKTSSRRLDEDQIIVLVIRLQDVFKTFSRRLQDVLQRSLQDVFKTYHQVKLFLLISFQNDFETYSKRFWDVQQRRLSIEGFA